LILTNSLPGFNNYDIFYPNKEIAMHDNMKSESGRSMLELLGYMALAGMIIAASMRLYNQARRRAHQAEFQMILDDVSRRTADIWLGRPFDNVNITAELKKKGVRLINPFGEFQVGQVPGGNFFWLHVQSGAMSVAECIETVSNNFSRTYCILGSASPPPLSALTEAQLKIYHTQYCQQLQLKEVSGACQRREHIYFFFKKN